MMNKYLFPIEIRWDLSSDLRLPFADRDSEIMCLDPRKRFLDLGKQYFCFLGIFQCGLNLFGPHPGDGGFGIRKDAFVFQRLRIFLLLQFFYISDGIVDGEEFSEIVRSHRVYRRTKDLFPCLEIDRPVFHRSRIPRAGSVDTERIGSDRNSDFHRSISK